MQANRNYGYRANVDMLDFGKEGWLKWDVT